LTPKYGEGLEGALAPSFHPPLPLDKGKGIQGMGLPNYYKEREKTLETGFASL